MAEFNSDLINTNARQRENPSKENWRREGEFEQSKSNSPEANLQSDSANGQDSASVTASQKSAQAYPELAELFQAWPKLPENLRLAILALIRAALNPNTK
jgi:hypothetical protein